MGRCPTLTCPTPLIYIYIYIYILFTGVEGRGLEFQEPLDLRSNPLQGGGDDAILPHGNWIEDSKKIGPMG